MDSPAGRGVAEGRQAAVVLKVDFKGILSSKDTVRSSPVWQATWTDETSQNKFILEFILRVRPASGDKFTSSQGKCVVELKCVSDCREECDCRMWVALAVGCGNRVEESKELEHDFKGNPVYRFRRTDLTTVWDLKKAVNPETQRMLLQVQIWRPSPRTL